MPKPKNVHIKTQLLEHFDALYDRYGGKFFDAMDDADSKKMNLNFCATIDLSEACPVVTTEVSFKDKVQEDGMNVSKTFSASVSDQLDDPNQIELLESPRRKKGRVEESEPAE